MKLVHVETIIDTHDYSSNLLVQFDVCVFFTTYYLKFINDVFISPKDFKSLSFKFQAK